MAKALKLNETQTSRLVDFQDYIDDKDDCIYVGDNDSFYGCHIYKVKILKTKIRIDYRHAVNNQMYHTYIEPSEIALLYRRAFKNDQDFKYYILNEQ